MSNFRPFPNVEQLLQTAEQVWASLDQNDWLEAFGRHPSVGGKKAPQKQSGTARKWSSREQSRVQSASERVRAQPQRWTMMVTVADPGDPTADPTKAWPADRRTIEVGTLVVQQIQAERDGPCRDINFDPTVLPAGMRTSDDPFPAARSAAYAKSYDLRTAEAKDYPRIAPEAKP